MSDRKGSGSFLNRWSVRKQQSALPVVNDAAVPEAGTASADLLDPADSTALLSDGLLRGELSGNDLNPAEPAFERAATCEHDAQLQNENPVPVEQTAVLLTDADMPDIETLTASSDISGFLGKGVSAALRKAALRHVFRQPRYNIRDGLDDYDDDYTFFEPLGDTVTSDMKFHAARKERARLANERLAQQQAQQELDMPDSAETGQDNTPPIEKAQTDKPAEENTVADQEAMPDADQERLLSVAAVEDDAGQDANLSLEQLPDRPDKDTPLNKTSLATASQSCETPNE